MSRGSLLLAALVLLRLWGLVLARNACADNPHDEGVVKAAKTPASPLDTPAGMRWIQGQPSHWRSLLLQR